MNLVEIAAMLGVSPASVSIVRNGRPGVGSATRRRIEKALEENGISYTPFTSPRACVEAPLKSSQSRYIHLVKFYRSALLTDKNEGFVDDIVDVIDAVVRSAGYSLLFSSISYQEYDMFLQRLSEDKSDGLLVIATEMSRNEILRLAKIQRPLVLLDSDYPCLPICSVSMDNRGLAYRAVLQLACLGEVGHLASCIPTGNFIARSIGYREAILALGLPAKDELIFRVTPSLTGACDDVLKLLDAGQRVPKSFFADNDVIAIGAMRALIQRGYRIPQDVQLIGVDNTLLSQISTPALSTTQISRVDLGENAIQLLLRQMAAPQRSILHIRTGTSLVLRDSTTL